MSMSAAYLTPAEGGARSNSDWAPEASRRGARLRGLRRAALARPLGRARSWSTAAARSRSGSPRACEGEVEVLNDVTLNQVLLAFGDDETTAAVIADLQAEGTLWAGGTRWHDRGALRFSVSNWSTTEADIDRSAEAILSAARRARG